MRVTFEFLIFPRDLICHSAGSFADVVPLMVYFSIATLSVQRAGAELRGITMWLKLLVPHLLLCILDGAFRKQALKDLMKGFS